MKQKHYSVLAAAIVTCAALLASAAMAEDRQHQDQDRGDRLARMQQHLGLSDDQVAEIRGIRKNGGSREDVRVILNDSQRAQFDEHHANRRGRQGEGKRHGERPPQQ
jgi:Spy/CpxP family protein refolding chaperone